MSKNKCIITLFFFFCFYLNCVPVVDIAGQELILTGKDLSSNSVFLLDSNMKNLGPVDYISDSIILYSLLWLNIAYNIPVIGNNISLAEDSGSNSFTDRLLLEPFAKDRKTTYIEPIYDLSGNQILDATGVPVSFPNGLFFSRNVIEPLAFYSYGLYLRAKNYHPAFYIGVLFTLSFLYEFTVKPFFMEASFEQLLKNPVIGITLSFIFDELSTYLLTTPYAVSHVFAYLINPFKLLPTNRVRPLIFFDPYKKSVSLEVILEL